MQRQTLSCLYFPLKWIIILIACPIVTLGYWMLSPLAFPLYVFRKILFFILHLFNPDLAKPVNCLGQLICRDYHDWLHSPSQTVTSIYKMKGSLTIQEARQLFLTKWVHRLDLNHQTLEYPELQQYFAYYMGQLIFQWDRSFDIANHVILYSNKEFLPNPETDMVDEATLLKIWENVTQKPFSERQSPWNVYLIPNYTSGVKTEKNEGNQFVVILRTHHGLCDGISIYRLFLALTDDGLVNLEKDIAAFRKVPYACMPLMFHLKAFFFGPASLVRKFADGSDICNPLHPPLRKKTGQVHILKSTIDVEVIKMITRVHLNVSFQSVLLAALAGGVRNYLLGNGHKIPLSPIRVGFPVPQPGHSLKLRNEFLVQVMDLPVHKKTAKQRLFAIEKKLCKMPSDAFMPFMTQMAKILGLFPPKVGRALTEKASITVLYSEIKGPSKPLSVSQGKYEILEVAFSIGLGTNDLGNSVHILYRFLK